MIFEEKKLGIESIKDLLQCEIRTVEPYALMLAPIYVFMKLNQKLVSVKAPLDFFTPEELAHLSRYETFYIPKFVQSGSRFQTAAKLVRNLLNPQPHLDDSGPASFEISNEVLLSVSTLWGKNLSIDPFYSAVFADELCGTFDHLKILHARETAVVRHEMGILLSGLLTFVLLHLGWLDFKMIQTARFDVYQAIVDDDENWEEPTSELELISRDIKRIVNEEGVLTVNSLIRTPSEWAKKLLGRLDRIKKLPNLRSYSSLTFSEEAVIRT